MKEIKEQIRLIKDIRKTRNKYRDIRLFDIHYKYLRDFFKKYKSYIIRLVIFIFILGVVEVVLIVFARNQLFSSRGFLGPFFWYFFGIFFTLFFVGSFIVIKQERTIIILFANSIRRRILKYFIEKPVDYMDYGRQGDLIAKVSYQLPLVSMGVSNVFFSTIRWFIYFVIAILIAYISDLNLAIILIVLVLLSILLGIIAYNISKKYISQEVTFFTKIIRHIDINLSEKYFNKNFNKESVVLKKFNRLVNIDSFFRIRRDLWMRMGYTVVFVIVLFIVVLSNFFRNNFFLWGNLLGTEDKFFYLFLMFYFPRALNQALKVGLYLFPARLGLFLTINKRGRFLIKKDLLKIYKEISFYSKKSKIFKESKYFRNLNFVFQKGERVLFYGKGFSGKTSLAKMFSGINIYNARAFHVKIDNNRFDYLMWQRSFCGAYFFDPNVKSEKSLIEFILGRNKEEIDIVDIEKVVKIISDNDFISSKISSLNNFNSSCGKILENTTQAFALHALHCIANKPSLVVIDNIWLDTNYDDIIKILNIISENLPDSIIVVFSRENNNYLNYKQKYELDNEIKKIQ